MGLTGITTAEIESGAVTNGGKKYETCIYDSPADSTGRLRGASTHAGTSAVPVFQQPHSRWTISFRGRDGPWRDRGETVTYGRHFDHNINLYRRDHQRNRDYRSPTRTSREHYTEQRRAVLVGAHN